MGVELGALKRAANGLVCVCVCVCVCFHNVMVIYDMDCDFCSVFLAFCVLAVAAFAVAVGTVGYRL